MIPAEFEDLLSRAGRKVLAGTHPLCGALADPRTRFVAAEDLIDRTKAARVRRVLEDKLSETLEPIERPIPPESIWDMRRDYDEQLPKTSRARTIYFESRREAGMKAAERIGLVRLMRSASFCAFAEAFSTPWVAHQWLVYSRAGHFSEIVPVGGPCTVTAYRLPFWHYTTPLVGGRNAARWVLLGTFLYR